VVENFSFITKGTIISNAHCGKLFLQVIWLL